MVSENIRIIDDDDDDDNSNKKLRVLMEFVLFKNEVNVKTYHYQKFQRSLNMIKFQ